MSKSSSSKSSSSSRSSSSGSSSSGSSRTVTRSVPISWSQLNSSISGVANAAGRTSSQTNSRARKIEQQNFTPSGREAGANASPLSQQSDLIKAMELAIANQNAQQNKTLEQAKEWASKSANMQSFQAAADRNFQASQARADREGDLASRRADAQSQLDLVRANQVANRPMQDAQIAQMQYERMRTDRQDNRQYNLDNRAFNQMRTQSLRDRNMELSGRASDYNALLLQQRTQQSISNADNAARVRAAELDANARIVSSAFGAFSNNYQGINTPNWWGNYARS